jgi:fimbrial chaperone protein
VKLDLWRLPRLAACLATSLACALPLAAFTLEPITALLSPSGPRSVATFRIANDGNERIAIKASILSRSVAPDGRETNEPDDGLFAVYPTRLLVEPGASSSLKIQWKGPAKLDSERCFRLLAEQVALSSGEPQGSGIRVKFRYLASVYVGEPRFAPELVATAKGTEGEGGRQGILVEIENRGSRHVVALGLGMELSGGGGGNFRLSSEELGALSGANYLPGFPRRLFVAREGAAPGTSYEPRLEFEGEY